MNRCPPHHHPSELHHLSAPLQVPLNFLRFASLNLGGALPTLGKVPPACAAVASVSCEARMPGLLQANTRLHVDGFDLELDVSYSGRPGIMCRGSEPVIQWP